MTEKQRKTFHFCPITQNGYRMVFDAMDGLGAVPALVCVVLEDVPCSVRGLLVLAHGDPLDGMKETLTKVEARLRLE